MPLPINDLQRHNRPLDDEIDAALNRVLDRGWYILGPEVKMFEVEFASYIGAGHGIGVANGTDALELALRALGVSQGDQVITVANAGMYSTIAIQAIGATPVYIDVDPVTMNLNPALLNPRGAKAIIATHLYGRMADMPAILQAAGDVPVIEDCAQAHGAEFQGKRAGSWGIAGCFSFYPTKNLGALGDAGAVVTSDMDLARRVRELRQYGWTEKYRADTSGGRNSRLDEIQAAVLKAKLNHLDHWNGRRRYIASRYSGNSYGPDYVAHLYVIRCSNRDKVRSILAQRGIATEVHYPTPDYRQASVNLDYSLPETERCCREVLTLPCFPEMTENEIDFVAVETRKAITESESV